MGRPESPMSNGRRLLADPRARVGALVLGLAVLAALFAPILGGDPYLQRDIVGTRFLSPLAMDHFGAFHLLGTDRFGRDVWARLLVRGTRLPRRRRSGDDPLHRDRRCLGASAGFWRGWIGATLLGFTDFALALPRVVLLLLLASLWQPSATLVVLVLGFTGWMPIARLVYGEVRALAVRPFVEGAVGLGVPGLRVLIRHILPNALTPVNGSSGARFGKCHSTRGGALAPRARRAPAGALVGKPDRIGTGYAGERAVGGRGAGGGAGAGGGGGDAAGRCGP